MKKLLFLLLLSSTCFAQSVTIKSGNWSNPATWKGGKVPGRNTPVIVNNSLTIDQSICIKGATINEGANLIFKATKTDSLTTTDNIIVYGRLTSHPSNFSITHTIIFDSVNEKNFIGGGMDIIPSDIGLWVRGNGILDLKGTSKTPWTNLNGDTLFGATTIKLKIIPKGWQPGDLISIAPTLTITSPGYSLAFDTIRIIKVIGSTVTIDRPLKYDHPGTSIYTAEVMNLTRNIRITSTMGRAHINIAMVANPQNLSYVEISNMGPRNDTAGVLGRYPLHFHHCTTGTAGSLIEGLVIKDCGNHAYVPHASYGITFKEDIAYNIIDDSWWWDLPPLGGYDDFNNSNDIKIHKCISAIVKPGNSKYRLANFLLGSGLRNSIDSSIAIGNQGLTGSAGFIWPESSNYTPNLWGFLDNGAHNQRTDGIFTWQNDSSNHTINGFYGANCGFAGIEHGAYTNAYKYNNCTLIGNQYAVYLHANTRPRGILDSFGYIIHFTNIQSIDPLYVNAHILPGGGPVLFKDCKFSKVIIQELPQRVLTLTPGQYDFVNCNPVFESVNMEARGVVRVQDNGQAYMIGSDGVKKAIEIFFK